MLISGAPTAAAILEPNPAAGLGVAKSVSRAFWSGGDIAKDAAGSFAVANGGKTLEMTRSGKALEWLTNAASYI
jgi:hypothetical protein